MDLAEAAHKARMSIGLGDEQLDVDDLGRMDAERVIMSGRSRLRSANAAMKNYEEL